MKLRDKKTGEVSDFDAILLVKDGRDGEMTGHLEYKSIEELEKKWEIVPGVKPFEEMVKVGWLLDEHFSAYNEEEKDRYLEAKRLHIADIDYYEILPDGTKKTKFTWDEAMEIEKKTNGKWRVPTQAEWSAIASAFGKEEDGTVSGEVLAKNLNLTVDEGGYGTYWSSTPSSYARARSLNFYDTNVYPQYSSYKPNGLTVRCVEGQI